MKKILLAIALMISVSAIAQTSWTSTYNKLSSYSNYYQKWDLIHETANNIEITFNNMDVRVVSKVPTTYHCYGNSRTSSGNSDNNGAWSSSEWWCYWWDNGVKKVGELRITTYQDGTYNVTIFFYKSSIYYALSYYVTN